MRRNLYNRSLGALLDCVNGVSTFSLDDQTEGYSVTDAEGNSYLAVPFYPDTSPRNITPFSYADNIVIEQVKISVSHAIGLRNPLSRPFSMGIAILEGEPDAQHKTKIAKMFWKDFADIDEWVTVDELFRFNASPHKSLYAIFQDMNIYYHTAQIDRMLHWTPIVLQAELAISMASERRK